MAEITTYGFERETYPEILEKVKDSFREHLGVEANLNDDSPLGQIAAIWAKLQNDNIRLAESVWSSQRLQGAEGVYLDDIFARSGVYRRGKQAASGSVLIETDTTMASNQTIPTTTQFVGGGLVFQPETEELLITNTSAFKIDLSEVVASEYTVTVVNTLDGATETIYLENDGSDASKIEMLETFAYAFLGVTEGNEDRVFYNQDTDELLIGYFTTNSNLVGIKETTEIQISPNIGTRHSLISVVATTTGYNPIPANTVKQITPSFTGFVSVNNTTAFYSGSEVESDAEFRDRYFDEVAALSGSTRDGITSAILKISGVSKVRLYDNPTSVDQPYADAFTFHPVVLGGTTAEISQAVYDNKPINTGTSGNVSLSVSTLDGATENIRHSKAVQVEVDVIVDYETIDRVPLSSNERSVVVAAIEDHINSQNIGETLYNTQLIFASLSSLTRSRVVSIKIRAKRSEDVDENFTSLDIVPDYIEVFVPRSGGIAFNQVV